MLADEACRHALNHRGVSHITFPVDYQDAVPSHEKTMHKQNGSTTSRWTRTFPYARKRIWLAQPPF
jgi:thiamine pyrophosphate-dependent acetolactate synthase large subunit-like protein